MGRLLRQDEFDKLLSLWSSDHVSAIEDIFSVKLTDQQKQLVSLAENPRCRVAISSGTGTGKTSVLTMMTLIYLMLLPDCRVLVTSPSFQQLSRVFYSELIKWHKKMPKQLQDLFYITRERVEYKGSSKYVQVANLVTASADNRESLQGGHGESFVIIGDEASGIPDDVFDVLLGTLSTGSGGRFILASNPVRSSGRFFDLFARDIPGWDKLFFSSLDSPNIDAEWCSEMLQMYGADSDLYRMRVLGRFPRVGSDQFISGDVVNTAIDKNLHPQDYINFHKVCGCDLARFGEDATVFCIRQGPKLLDFKMYKGLDTMEVAGKLAEYKAVHQPSKIFIDSIGIGAGTFDRCKQLGLPVAEVIVSNRSTEPNTYCNLRSQIWGKMRDWLANGADIPSYSRERDTNLAAQLTSMIYFYNSKMQLQLMSKKDLKRLGNESPDIADSLALTFADSIFEVKSRLISRPIRQAKFMWV